MGRTTTQASPLIFPSTPLIFYLIIISPSYKGKHGCHFKEKQPLKIEKHQPGRPSGWALLKLSELTGIYEMVFFLSCSVYVCFPRGLQRSTYHLLQGLGHGDWFIVQFCCRSGRSVKLEMLEAYFQPQVVCTSFCFRHFKPKIIIKVTALSVLQFLWGQVWIHAVNLDDCFSTGHPLCDSGSEEINQLWAIKNTWSQQPTG